jgi:glutaredoxin
VISNTQLVAGRLLLVSFLLVVASGAQSEIYRWTDENGKVHFSDQPSRKHTTEAVEVRVNTYESVSIDTSVLRTGKKVIMYSASWCAVCKKAKSYFKKNGIKFTEYDIEKSAKGRSDYRKLNASGVPVILVGEQRMNGFDIEAFKELYQ